MYVIRNKVSGKYWSVANDATGFHTCWANDLQCAIILNDPMILAGDYEEKVKIKIDPVTKEVSLV